MSTRYAARNRWRQYTGRAIVGTRSQGAWSMVPSCRACERARKWARWAIAGAHGQCARSMAQLRSASMARASASGARWCRGASRAIDGATRRARRAITGAIGKGERSTASLDRPRAAWRRGTGRAVDGAMGKARDRWRQRARRALDGANGQGARSKVRAGKARARLRAWASRVIGGANGRGARSLATTWATSVIDGAVWTRRTPVGAVSRVLVRARGHGVCSIAPMGRARD